MISDTHTLWRTRLTKGQLLKYPPVGFCHRSHFITTVIYKRRGCYSRSLTTLDTLTFLSKVARMLPASKTISTLCSFHGMIHSCVNFKKHLSWSWVKKKTKCMTWVISWGSMIAVSGPCSVPGYHGRVGVASPWYLFREPQSHPGSHTTQSAIHWRLVGQEAQGWTPHQYHQAQGIWRAPGTSDFCQLIGFGEAADLLSTEWLLWTWNPACLSSLINLGQASWLVPLQTACLREAGWWLDNLLSNRETKLQNGLSRNGQCLLRSEGRVRNEQNHVWYLIQDRRSRTLQSLKKKGNEQIRNTAQIKENQEALL